ncbi:unnamed protein product, partial [marine sediment metagenome]
LKTVKIGEVSLSYAIRYQVGRPPTTYSEGLFSKEPQQGDGELGFIGSDAWHIFNIWFTVSLLEIFFDVAHSTLDRITRLNVHVELPQISDLVLVST